jgi:hypothetical protein
MKITKHEMLLQAAEPIAHAQETLGNKSMLMRKKVRGTDGFVSVPYLTGDTLRNKLRCAAAYGTLHAAGILDDPQLSEGAARLLFAGGMLTGRGDAGTVNLDRYRQLVALFPPLALLGGCTDNRAIAGQLDVSEGNLVCKETRRYLPDWAADWLAAHEPTALDDTRRSVVEEVQRVRMDPLLSPGNRQLLSDEARANVESRMLRSETAHTDGDAASASDSKSSMLPRTHERIAQGAYFWFSVTARTYSAIEEDALDFTLGVALQELRIGGKAGTGHGLLRFVHGARIHFTHSPGKLESTDSEMMRTRGNAYQDYVVSKKEELSTWLRSKVNS